MARYQIKRVYVPATEADGTRVLVDRVWPRGITRQKAAVSQWLKEVAPSMELRKWFGHDPARFEEFRRRYGDELKGNAALDELRKLKGVVTLVYSAHDEAHNQAVVLRELLEA